MDTLARKLERTSLVKESISFYSHKTLSIQYCESRLEANAALLKEFDHSIESYVTQPTSIFYMKNAKKYRYTPDSLVKKVNGEFYFEEVKPLALTHTAEFKDKFDFLSRYFEQVIGYPLVINSVQISSASIANYQNLYFFQHQNINLHDAKELLKKSPLQTCIDELCGIATAIKVPTSLAWQLIAQGYYEFNNNNLINKDTLLERNLNDK